MKRTMTLNAFERYIRNRKPSKVVLDTDNQKWTYAPLHFHLSFSEIRICYAPDRIYLSGENTMAGHISLKLVKRIRVNEHDIHTTATVTCGTVDGTENAFNLLLFP